MSEQGGYEDFVQGQYQTSVKLRQTRAGGNESMYGKTAHTTPLSCIKCGKTDIVFETTDEGLVCLDCALGGESNG